MHTLPAEMLACLAYARAYDRTIARAAEMESRQVAGGRCPQPPVNDLEYD